jgi:hypothetical protein
MEVGLLTATSSALGLGTVALSKVALSKIGQW